MAKDRNDICGLSGNATILYIGS